MDALLSSVSGFALLQDISRCSRVEGLGEEVLHAFHPESLDWTGGI